jgi:hypothetical protein
MKESLSPSLRLALSHGMYARSKSSPIPNSLPALTIKTSLIECPKPIDQKINMPRLPRHKMRRATKKTRNEKSLNGKVIKPRREVI